MPISRPSVPLFLGSLLPNPWLAIILMILVSFWFYNTIPPVLVATSRALFAMSFDRSLPKAFANVNSRGVPTWATHVAMIFGLLAILVFAQNVTLIVAILDITTLFIFWLFGIAAMLLPFRRPDIYKLSPVQKDFLGLPVITWLGLLTTAIGLFFVFFSAVEITTASQAILCGIILVMYLFHVISQMKAIKEGIDVSKIYAEIPPE
jgi:amino acid transporter